MPPRYDPGPHFRADMQSIMRGIERKAPPHPNSRFGPTDIAVNTINGLVNALASSPVGKGITAAGDKLPKLQEVEIPTPFGRVKTPEVRIPELKPVELDDRKREAIKATAGIDAVQIVGVIPIVGDIIADIVEDIYAEKLNELLSDEERHAYTRNDKIGPSTIALARTFMRR